VASSESAPHRRFLFLGWWWLAVLTVLVLALIWVATATLEAG